MNYNNPFEYEAANKLGPDKIIDFYIADYNYSRFIRSRRNIFLVGERGCGKTMTLLYNSLPVQKKLADREQRPLDLAIACIHIPCNTPLTHKREYQLLDDYEGGVISEHFLVTSMMYAIVQTLSEVPCLLSAEEEVILRDELNYVYHVDLPASQTILRSLLLHLQREVGEAQRILNSKRPGLFYENALSFSSGVIPLLTALRNTQKLHQAHFALMLDDAHNLNTHQIRTLNSWIAFRDNVAFSFKIATAKVDRPSLLTSTGGEIFEGHDFTVVDMEQPYQNRFSDFGNLARQIVSRRLEKNNIACTPEEFFPTHPQLEEDLAQSAKKVREEISGRLPAPTKKQVADHVYKYKRVEYFRARHARSNLPPYSGFETLVHLSTGVIRNFLEPCYWMYDRVFSAKSLDGDSEPRIEAVPPTVQHEIILDRSKRKWEFIKSGLDTSIDGCSRQQAEYLYDLFDGLAKLFKERLLKHRSEPRALKFVVTETEYEHFHDLEELLTIARRAQLLYVYRSSGKELAKRETYYVPNRILWPERGLDPLGQHAFVSLKARHLWAAATQKKKIPFSSHVEESDQAQKGLFS